MYRSIFISRYMSTLTVNDIECTGPLDLISYKSFDEANEDEEYRWRCCLECCYFIKSIKITKNDSFIVYVC